MIHWAELQWFTKQLFIVIYLMHIDSKDQIKADLLFQVRRGKVRQMSGGADFVAIALMSNEFMQWVIRRGKTTAGQANLTLDRCRAFPIPVPPLAEQTRIVAEVDHHHSMDRGVEAEVEISFKLTHALRQATWFKAFGAA